MQHRIHNNKKIRFRGNGYGKTACLSFNYHDLELMKTWDALADQSFSSKSGVFKKFLRNESKKLKERKALQETLHAVDL